MSFGNTIVSLVFNIQRGRNEIIVFTEARVVKTTEAAASVASNVATALLILFNDLTYVLRYSDYETHTVRT